MAHVEAMWRPSERAHCCHVFAEGWERQGLWRLARMARFEGFCQHPEDAASLLRLGACSAHESLWGMFATAAWHSLHRQSGDASSYYYLTMALHMKGLRTQARRIGEQGLTFNPHLGLQMLLNSIGRRSSPADTVALDVYAKWSNVAPHLADAAILQLVGTGKDIRNCIFGPSPPTKRAIVISTNNHYENLWQHQPSWVVGMLVSQIAPWRVVHDYRFPHDNALRDFLHAAFLLESYADVHGFTWKYFVRFRFEPRDVRHFLATPLEDNHHVNSNLIHLTQKYCISLALSHEGWTIQDGFNLHMWPPGSTRDEALYAASCVNGEFAMISTRASSHLNDAHFLGAKCLHEHSALFEAIRTGQELPFLVVTISRIAGGR